MLLIWYNLAFYFVHYYLCKHICGLGSNLGLWNLGFQLDFKLIEMHIAFVASTRFCSGDCSGKVGYMVANTSARSAHSITLLMSLFIVLVACKNLNSV